MLRSRTPNSPLKRLSSAPFSLLRQKVQPLSLKLLPLRLIQNTSTAMARRMAPPTPTTTPTTILLVLLKPEELLLDSFSDEAVGTAEDWVTVLVTTTVCPSVTEEYVVAKTVEVDEVDDSVDDDDFAEEADAEEVREISLEVLSDEETDDDVDSDIGVSDASVREEEDVSRLEALEEGEDEEDEVVVNNSDRLELSRVEKTARLDRTELLCKDRNREDAPEVENAEDVVLDDSSSRTWMLETSRAIKPYFSAILATASPWGICNDRTQWKCKRRHARSTGDFMGYAKEGKEWAETKEQRVAESDLATGTAFGYF